MPRTWEDPGGGSGLSFGMPTPLRVVRTLLIANVAIFLVHYLLLEGTFPRAFALVSDAFALNPAQWVAHFPLVPVWQLVSYGFLHGSPQHILVNLLFLYFLGTMLESEIGGQRFLAFYLVAVAVAGACQLVLGLALGQTAPIVGASGGVLAIVCAMATLRPNLRMIFIIVPLTLRTVALIYVGMDLFGALAQLKGGGSDVASFAHLSGALFGFLAVRRNWIWSDPLARLAAWRTNRDEDRKAGDQERLDALLAKITREGIHALSTSEKAFLKRVSRHK